MSEREIKFRAFNKVTNQMVDLHKITPLALSVEQKGVFLPFHDDWPLMQFTGLKDKHGIEIFQGDIVTCDAYPFIDEGKQNYVGTVEWIYSQWQVVLHCVNPAKAGISDGMNQGLNETGLEEGEQFHDLTVIGNIHENADLVSPAPDSNSLEKSA